MLASGNKEYLPLLQKEERWAADFTADGMATWYYGYVMTFLAVPYGDHQPFPAHEDNGKCSSADVLFDMLGDREAAEFFARMSTAAYSERERGHTGNCFNVLWALPGVARGGPLATAPT